MNRVLVFGHSVNVSLSLASLLKSHRFNVEYVDRSLIQFRENLIDHDLQIHLGSDLSVANGVPNVEVESELKAIRMAISAGIPILGICFGAQLLSMALGGTVIRSEEPEIGWYELDATPIGVTRATRWMQWHYDSIISPQCADELIAGKFGAQAFKYENCLGLQFHPEVDYEEIVRWMSDGGEQEVSHIGISANALLEDSRVYSGQSKVGFFELFEWFLALGQISGSHKV